VRVIVDPLGGLRLCRRRQPLDRPARAALMGDTCGDMIVARICSAICQPIGTPGFLARSSGLGRSWRRIPCADGASGRVQRHQVVALEHPRPSNAR